MIRNLNFDVTFASNGKQYKDSHNFELGLTAITGRNEAGKSLRLEMIRYALFGNKALRSEVKNYTSVSAELEFVIGGADYKIERKNSKASLSKGGEPIATGTKPVNDAIVRIFGYDLEVFDIANACLQGEIEALTNKTPAERKKMVDRTIGLDAVDEVIKSVGTDQSATRQAVAMLEEKVIEKLEEPIHPQFDTSLEFGQESLTSSAEMQPFINQLEGDLKNKTYWEGQLQSLKIDEPVPPVFTTEVKETLEELQEALTAIEVRKAGLSEVKSKLKSLEMADKIIKDNSTTVEDVEKYILGGYEKQWAEYKAYKSKEVEPVIASLDDLHFVLSGLSREQTPEEPKIECPECKHNFTLVETKEDEFDWARYHSIRALYGLNTSKDVTSLIAKVDKWEEFLKLTPVGQPAMPELVNLAQLRTALQLYTDLGEFDEAVAESELLEGEAKYERDRGETFGKITLLKIRDEAIRTYHTKLEQYLKYKALSDELQPKIDKLHNTDIKLAAVKSIQQELHIYEKAKAVYDSKVAGQKAAVDALADLTTNLTTLVNVKKALTELKPKVKMHLLPSLNSVASALVSEMTGAQRSSIVVDDNFDITVDGDPINTLSGSAKAVANLSVRIGLGTVLTNKVFSVLLADEIDSAMDSDRAEFTAQCLANLTNTIGQIILVSHKTPEADHQIEVK